MRRTARALLLLPWLALLAACTTPDLKPFADRTASLAAAVNVERAAVLERFDMVSDLVKEYREKTAPNGKRPGVDTTPAAKSSPTCLERRSNIPRRSPTSRKRVSPAGKRWTRFSAPSTVSRALPASPVCRPIWPAPPPGMCCGRWVRRGRGSRASGHCTMR